MSEDEKLGQFFYDHASNVYVIHEEEDDDAVKRNEILEAEVLGAYGETVLKDMRVHSQHLLDLEYAQDNADYYIEQAKAIRAKYHVPESMFEEFGG